MKRSELKRKTPLESHSQLKRTELKRTPFVRRKTKRQAQFDAELNAVKKGDDGVMVRAMWSCEAKVPGVCQGMWSPLDCHHRRKRNVNFDGKRNVPSNILVCCQACHRYIHAEVDWSKLHRFILSTKADPDELPVIPVGRWFP